MLLHRIASGLFPFSRLVTAEATAGWITAGSASLPSLQSGTESMELVAALEL